MTEQPEGATAPAQQGLRERLVALARDHTAPVISFTLATVFVVKLMLVSSGDATTALGLLSYADLTQTLFGLVLVSFPFVVVLLFLYWLSVWRHSSDPLRRVGVLVLLSFVSCFVLPWPALCLGLIVAAIALRRHRRASVTADFGAVVMALVLLGAGPPLWLPAQQFEFRSGRPLTGYELSRDADRVVILRDDDRRIVQRRSRDVRSQHFCQTDRTLNNGTVYGLLLGDPDYPSC